ncbi:MAG: hypothetical protein LBP26_00040 [Clostridiales bacterium]|jgi:hypothetical protein|nr:hypothetical protein [Clostridiales bacterium]
MKKLRKTLGSAESPSVVGLMRLIETQSKTTVAEWALDYAERKMIPLYEKRCPNDGRPARAIEAAREWLAGRVKLPYVRNIILNECHAAARELDGNPAAQAAARAVGQAAASVHAATHSLGLYFYAAAAIAYDRLGFDADGAEYDRIAEEVCADYAAALAAVAIENEPKPVKCKWNC